MYDLDDFSVFINNRPTLLVSFNNRIGGVNISGFPPFLDRIVKLITPFFIRGDIFCFKVLS